jgi:NADH dehydrogenase FAD-containing subunit
MQRKRIVLIGAGHAHLHVAAHAAELARAGARLVLVEPGNFWYSGLATGMLAGQYEAQTDQIDPAALVARGGGQLVRDRLARVDAGRRTLILASGNTLQYDVLSLNVGSEVHSRGIAGAEQYATGVKPISNLWRLREELELRFRQSAAQPVCVVVVGGGPTGCEVAACIDSLARRRGAGVQLTLVSRDDRLLAGLPAGASRSMAGGLARRGIAVVPSMSVQEIEHGAVVGSDGRRLHADLVVLATGLTAHSTVRQLDLPMGADGLRVRATLQSVADERIFATGDCAGLEGHRLPKLGVFGVRQGPVLLHNLSALLRGDKLRQYRPQRLYLMIFNLGCGRALAVYGRAHWFGRLSFWVKDRIDRRFLRQYARQDD